MFDKSLRIPQLLLEAEALEGRTPLSHPLMPELRSLIRILRSGYNGEKTINFYLSQIHNERYHIFHNLRLPWKNSYFQIDFLLLSTKIILLLEGKNHSGKLIIERNQMIHETYNKRDIYENPISQANRHKILLTYLLQKYQIPAIPIEFFVVICKNSTEVVISPGYNEAEEKVFKANDLLNRIEEKEQFFKKDKITPKTVEKIRDILLENHTPAKEHILDKIQINESEILTGVHCPKCLFLPMEYRKNVWICPSCHFISQDAFLKTLNDYFLLINPYINNSEMRRFFHLPNSRVATYLLSLMNLPYQGKNRGRIYFLNVPIIFSTPKTNTIKNKNRVNMDEKNLVDI